MWAFPGSNNIGKNQMIPNLASLILDYYFLLQHFDQANSISIITLGTNYLINSILDKQNFLFIRISIIQAC